MRAPPKSSATEHPRADGISLERLDALRPWARTAWAARCALRALPLFAHLARKPYAGLAADLDSLEGMILFAVNVATRREVPAAPGREQTDRMFAGWIERLLASQELEPRSSAVLACAAGAARTALAEGDARLAAETLEAGTSAAVAEFHDAAEYVEAATADLAWFSTARTDDEAAPRAFFERYLWPGGSQLSTAWRGVLRDWDRLTDLAERDGIRARYDEVVRKGRVDWGMVDRIARRWADTQFAPTQAAAPAELSVNEPAETDAANAEPAPATATATAPPPAEAPSDESRPDLRMLSDAELTDDAGDRLDFKVYADALALLIKDPDTLTPLTIAINAPWGAGKSSLARMVRNRLRGDTPGDEPNVTCAFNAWLHDDADNLAAAFAARIARVADRARPVWRQVVSPLPSSLLSPRERTNRRLFQGLLWLLLIASIALYGLDNIPGALDKPQLDTFARVFTAFGPVAGGLFILGSAVAWVVQLCLQAARAVADYVADPAGASQSGTMAQAREQLGQLIRQATPPGGRFVVFVDDLERCRPPASVDVLEVVNQLLAHPDVVTVVMADMPAVAACAEVKYEKLASLYAPTAGAAGTSTTGRYGRLYLQKIVQLQVDLPPHSEQSVAALIEDLVGAGRPGNGDSHDDVKDVGAIRALGRRVRRLWIRQGSLLNQLRAMSRGDGVNRVLGPVVWVAFLPLVWAANLAGGGAARRQGLRLEATGAALALQLAAFVAGIPYVYAGYRLLRELLSDGPWLAVVPWLLLGLASVIVTGITGSLAAWLHRRREGRVQRAAEGIAVDLFAEGGTPDVVQQAIAQRTGFKGDVDKYVNELRLRFLANKSDLMLEARAAMMQHLPRLPRSAKRTLNTLRVLLHIAHERRVFGGDPALTPAHLGKWVALRERWPELAQVLTERPTMMAELEALCAKGPKFARLVRTLSPEDAADRALRDLCSTAPPLGPVLPRLVTFVRPGDVPPHRAPAN